MKIMLFREARMKAAREYKWGSVWITRVPRRALRARCWSDAYRGYTSVEVLRDGNESWEKVFELLDEQLKDESQRESNTKDSV